VATGGRVIIRRAWSEYKVKSILLRRYSLKGKIWCLDKCNFVIENQVLLPQKYFLHLEKRDVPDWKDNTIIIHGCVNNKTKTSKNSIQSTFHKNAW
jgi:hypothetical protein